jgi:DNA-binding transcriptional regulator YiaG
MTDYPPAWDADRVRALRAALGDTQQAFAERLGTRQQTVSEWERGTSHPRRMARRLLGLLAEEHGVYDAAPDTGEPPSRLETRAEDN